MVASNGKPVLVDGRGNPLRHRDGAPHPEARGLALPHGFLFIARQGGAGNTWLHDRYDEALRHSRDDALVMARDCWLGSLLNERIRAVKGMNWHLEVPDEKDKYQVHVKDTLTRLVKGTAGLRRLLGWWLEAIWYGRYGVQVAWDWTAVRDHPDPKKAKQRRGLVVSEAWPVNGDKIGHQQDHTPYVLVNAAAEGELEGRAEFVSTTLGRGMLLTGSWRERFVLHKYLMEDADWFDSEQAEAVHGVGVRSKIFWTNFMRLEWLSNIAEFFGRVGLGLTVWKYPQGNAQALAAVKAAALEQSDRSHIFVPVSPEGGQSSGNAVERIEVPTSGADALVKLIEYLEKAIERFVVGQEGSASATSSSGHSNQSSSDFQRDTKAQIAVEDAGLLADTLTGTPREPGLVNTMLRHTFPEADFPVQWVFDADSGESAEKLQAIKTLVDLGIPTRADDARKAAGVGKPADGDEPIQPPQAPGMPGATPGSGAGAPLAGGAPGGAGGNPLAALMGGGCAPATGSPAPAGDLSVAPAPEPEAAPEGHAEGPGRPEQTSPEAEKGQGQAEPQGDFLDALRMAKRPASRHYARVGAAVRRLRRQGRDDLADALVRAYARRPLSDAPDETRHPTKPDTTSPDLDSAEGGAAPLPYVRDARGHEHGTDGKFVGPGQGGTGADGKPKPPPLPATKPKPPPLPKRPASPPPLPGKVTPPPLPKPAPPPRPVASPPAPAKPAPTVKLHSGLTAHGKVAVRGLAKAIWAGKGLSDGQRHHYLESVQHVVGAMSPRAQQRVAAHLTAPASFHASVDGVKEELIGSSSDPARARDRLGKLVTGGAYQTTGGKSRLVLDGDPGPRVRGDSHIGTTARVYAHEFSHAIDGPSHELSDSREWADAFKAELAGGKLNAYAATKPSEGFAEFGRLLLGGEHGHALVKARFPRCFAFWQRQGLVAAPAPSPMRHARTSEGPMLDELFSEAVELPGGGHADILADAEVTDGE